MKPHGPGMAFDCSLDNPNSLQDSHQNPSHESSIDDASNEKCVFCPKLKNFIETFQMLNKALYLKYSSSQNYYYTKDINDLVENEKKPHVINFKFRVNFEEEEENLTRFYNSSEFDYKLSYLTEYYKYHKEVPRMFMVPVSNLMNNYHDKKRRIEYFKIKKMLNEQNKGVVTNNERESTEEKKTSVYSEDSEKNDEDKAIKLNDNSSKILALLDVSSKNEILKKEDLSRKEEKMNDVYDFFQKQAKKQEENQEVDSITLEELNFYLNKIPGINENQIGNQENDRISPIDAEILTKQELNENLNEINFEYSEVKPIKPLIISEAFDPHNINIYSARKAPLENDARSPEGNLPVSIYSNPALFRSEAPRSGKGYGSLEEKKPPNNLQKALKHLENLNTNSSQPTSNSHNKASLSQLMTFRDFSKNIQIFNKLIERQKSQMRVSSTPSNNNNNNNNNSNNMNNFNGNRNNSSSNNNNKRPQTSSKSHRNVNSIDFNALKSPAYKTVAVTPKNFQSKDKTKSVASFQQFMHPNKEKLTEFIQAKLNLHGMQELNKANKNAEKAAKNSSSNSIQKPLMTANVNHRRIQSSENGKQQCYSAKNLPKSLIKSSVFQSALQKKTQGTDLFHENIMYSPKPILTTVSEYSPNKHVKHFKPVSPTTILATTNPIFSSPKDTLASLRKPQPVGFRKLNLDEKIYAKKNRIKPKSFQLQTKPPQERNNQSNDSKGKDQGNSKNTSMNSKASGNLTANSRKGQQKTEHMSAEKKLQKGSSSQSLKINKRDDNESKNQQMKINIISNFFNFNNGGEHDKDPIMVKLKNEFSNLKAFPNYKFLDISKRILRD